jgi:ABC-type bacteriocin/lantibiotic exporter with double-glycine peptidase domain
MSYFKLPLYSQQKDNTCALASLRMVLVAFGSDVEESTLESQARLREDGTEIGELERLARQFGLIAEIHEATVEQLRQFLAEGRLVLAYLDRARFDLTPHQRAKHSLRAAKIHVVVPTRITAQAVTSHDPRPPARIVRKSIRLFRSAYESLGSCGVVCSHQGGT